MRRVFSVLVLLASVAGCEVQGNLGASAPKERPTVNVPAALRQSNWRGPQGQGSCVHASMISLFRWQYRLKTADYWRRAYGDGEYPEDLAAKFDHEGIRYAYVTNGDVRSWNGRAARGEAAASRSWAGRTWSHL